MKCPKCKKKIEYFLFEADVIEIGHYDGIDWNLRDTQDSLNGEYRFYCPECDTLITKSIDRANKLLKGK